MGKVAGMIWDHDKETGYWCLDLGMFIVMHHALDWHIVSIWISKINVDLFRDEKKNNKLSVRFCIYG
jgi:hypothetical protein